MTVMKTQLFLWPGTRSLAGLLTAILLLGDGCAPFQPARSTGRYYFLTPIAAHPAGAVSRRGMRVRLEPIELAEFLNTRKMVVRTGTNEVRFAEFHQWAEPLSDGLRRVLAENLRALPGRPEVVTSPIPQGSPPALVISIRVLACQGARVPGGGAAEFAAIWRLSVAGRVLERGRFSPRSAAWSGEDYGTLAHALSRAVGGLADELEAALSRHAGASPAS